MVEGSRSSCGAILAGLIRIALLSVAIALAAVAAAAAFTQSAEAAGVRSPVAHARQARGIVQSISTKAVVLKQLDGSTLIVALDAKTRVFVNGKRASLADVEPGFAAVATWQPGRPAQVLRTFDPSRRHGRGVPSHRPPLP
jgi:hypothetical protein